MNMNFWRNRATRNQSLCIMASIYLTFKYKIVLKSFYFLFILFYKKYLFYETLLQKNIAKPNNKSISKVNFTLRFCFYISNVTQTWTWTQWTSHTARKLYSHPYFRFVPVLWLLEVLRGQVLILHTDVPQSCRQVRLGHLHVHLEVLLLHLALHLHHLLAFGKAHVAYGEEDDHSVLVVKYVGVFVATMSQKMWWARHWPEWIYYLGESGFNIVSDQRFLNIQVKEEISNGLPAIFLCWLTSSKHHFVFES